MDINLATKLQEFKKGWEMVGVLAGLPNSSIPRATLPSPSGAFYLLGWWWEGEHILIPERLEEERMAAELEEAFGADQSMAYLPMYSAFSDEILSNPMLIRDNNTAGLVVNPSGGSTIGFWAWESVKIGATTPPTFLRKWLIKVLLGATFEPSPPPIKKSLPTPWSVLLEYLSSIET
jgi:hypothetical protein